MKSQMKRADASGARYALIIGDDEAAANAVAVKPLRDERRAGSGAGRRCPQAAPSHACPDHGHRNVIRTGTDHGSLRSARTGTTRRPQGMVAALRQSGDDARPSSRRSRSPVIKGGAGGTASRRRRPARCTPGRRQARGPTTCKRPRTPTAQLEDRFRTHGLRAARGAAAHEAAVRQRRYRGCAHAASMGDRPRRRDRTQGNRALSAGRAAAEREAVRRGAQDARRQARRALRRRFMRTCAATRSPRPAATTTRRRPTSSRLPSSTPNRRTVTMCR